MRAAELIRAVDAAVAIAGVSGLTADHATVLQNSNNLVVRLVPCDVVARIAPVGQGHASFEVALAVRLTETNSPVVALDRRVEPSVHERDGFEISLWTYFAPTERQVTPAAYADALERLHGGMRRLDLPTPHFTDRVQHAARLLMDRRLTPELTDGDRAMLLDRLRRMGRLIGGCGADEQALHGEPHPGNLLSTRIGPLFVDLETCCRGPVEFDLAHVPAPVSDHYPRVDQALLGECRQLVLAMVAAWRWETDDQFPNGRAFGRELLQALHAGPPWPTIDDMVSRLAKGP